MKTSFRSNLQKVWPVIFAVILIWGCERNPADPSLVSENDSKADQATQVSIEFYDAVSSAQSAGELMRGAGARVALQEVQIDNPSGAFAQAKRAKQVVLTDLQAHPARRHSIDGVQGDSLLWQATSRKPFEGYTETVRLYYDAATGKARLEAIKFDFDDRHWLHYDSAAIHVDLNRTIFDDSDDVLLSLEELKQYKAGHHLREKQGRFIPDAYAPGTEPAGGMFESKTVYAATSFIQQTEERAEFHQATGGEWQKMVTYSDGSTSSERVTFNIDETGSFEELRRDGTKITGTFDSAEKDGAGSFEKTTTFPAGSNPASIYETGTFTMDVDSTLHGSFSKEVRFADGEVLREHIEIDESFAGGFKTTRVAVQKADGSSGVIVIEERTDGTRVTGEVTEADGTFYLIKIDGYPDGSARLEFKCWAAKQDYLDGEPPLVEGVINFNPDHSGTGSVRADGTTQSITIAPDGSQQLGS